MSSNKHEWKGIMSRVFLMHTMRTMYILCVPKFTANMYCVCLSIPQIYTKADTVQIYGKFWDTQYNHNPFLAVNLPYLCFTQYTVTPSVRSVTFFSFHFGLILQKIPWMKKNTIFGPSLFIWNLVLLYLSIVVVLYYRLSFHLSVCPSLCLS